MCQIVKTLKNQIELVLVWHIGTLELWLAFRDCDFLGSFLLMISSSLFGRYILVLYLHVLIGAATMGTAVPLAVNWRGTSGCVAMEPILWHTKLTAVCTSNGDAWIPARYGYSVQQRCVAFPECGPHWKAHWGAL